MKLKFLLSITLAAIVGAGLVDPLPQDPAYHHFADRQTLLGIPNFWNVISNSPFVVIGLYGLWGLAQIAQPTRYKTTAIIFFVGVTLTGFGSGYYHYSPSNETLLWDRLPMTLSFMAFFVFILSAHISERLASALLWPLIALGIASVLYWGYTESHGRGDLRFYGLIQFLPMLLTPIIVVLFTKPNYQANYVWIIMGLYIAAKLMEHFDYPVHALIGFSGHSLKHIIASFTGVAFLWALQSVERVSNKL